MIEGGDEADASSSPALYFSLSLLGGTSIVAENSLVVMLVAATPALICSGNFRSSVFSLVHSLPSALIRT